MTKGSRRGVGFGAVAVASALALASPAFACGTWAGKFTVTAVGGNYPGSVSESIGAGPGNGMTRCPGQTELKAAKIAPAPAVGKFSVTVTSAAANGCGDNNKLPRGIYTINWVPRVERDLINTLDCMNATEGGAASGVGKPLGEMWIDGSGNSLTGGPDSPVGSRTYSVESPQDIGGSLVCISNVLIGWNNQVQVQFTI